MPTEISTAERVGQILHDLCTVQSIGQQYDLYKQLNELILGSKATQTEAVVTLDRIAAEIEHLRLMVKVELKEGR
jgi:hypothetical protein